MNNNAIDNLRVYNAVCAPPPESLKQIEGGRLKGMTDINPMWRIRALTEQYGPCGIGWKYTILKQWTEPGADGVIAAFCNIDLFVKEGERWSDGIPGTGGSLFVAKETGKLYTSDECYKMALTDALSVACKSLGFGANVYWRQGATKYSTRGSDMPDKSTGEQKICPRCSRPIKGIKYNGEIRTAEEVCRFTGGYCFHCHEELKKAAEENGT